MKFYRKKCDLTTFKYKINICWEKYGFQMLGYYSTFQYL